MTLNAPRVLFFIISLVIALVSVLSLWITQLGALPISNFWLMTIAYVILALACVIKGM
jgi:hypothetical protein